MVSIGAGELIILIISILIFGLIPFYCIVYWKIFVKAGKPGWAIFIPIYNLIVFLEIVNRPLWWLIFLIIPIVNLVIHVIVHIDLAKSFRQDLGFGLGLAFLGAVFYPILAFGSAQYSFPNR
tara:strand:+ start:1016 stop:1381 length:366 start_codon:yes stop_codon:yes gene_type:complete